MPQDSRHDGGGCQVRDESPPADRAGPAGTAASGRYAAVELDGRRADRGDRRDHRVFRPGQPQHGGGRAGGRGGRRPAGHGGGPAPAVRHRPGRHLGWFRRHDADRRSGRAARATSAPSSVTCSHRDGERRRAQAGEPVMPRSAGLGTAGQRAAPDAAGVARRRTGRARHRPRGSRSGRRRTWTWRWPRSMPNWGGSTGRPAGSATTRRSPGSHREPGPVHQLSRGLAEAIRRGAGRGPVDRRPGGSDGRQRAHRAGLRPRLRGHRVAGPGGARPPPGPGAGLAVGDARRDHARPARRGAPGSRRDGEGARVRTAPPRRRGRACGRGGVLVSLGGDIAVAGRRPPAAGRWPWRTAPIQAAGAAPGRSCG